MSFAIAPPRGDLDVFLDRLAAEGYAVGIGERLVAHALLERLAERNELPPGLGDQLRLLEPLLSRTADEQRRFGDLVTGFIPVSDDGGPGLPRSRVVHKAGAAAPHRRALAVLVVLCLLWLTWQSWPGSAPVTTRPPAGQVSTDAASQRGPARASKPVYVPVGSFPEAGDVVSRPNGRWGALRWSLGAAGAALALGLAAWLVQRMRRGLYLQAVRSDDEVEDHLLRDPAPVELAVPEHRVRSASRLLRQRVAGSRDALDLGATLEATARSGGALAPRFRSLHQTPEYLVLIDRRSVHDHQAAVHELLVGALRRFGVAVDLFHYDGSPAQGCWQDRERGEGAASGPRSWASFAQLLSRYGGHRLLVFGDAAMAFEPISGRPATWARDAVHFTDRAWLSPIPLTSWGAAEEGLSEAGFLVLPTQVEALETLAEWLASGRATLRAGTDRPGVFPPALHGSTAAWVARQAPPPLEAQEDLIVELRLYLGPRRFQWLCACAIFPVLSWPLTLAFGRAVLPAADPQALLGGVGMLAALPWFRHGRMPAWLREALLDRLEAEHERELRTLVERRLAAALHGSRGEPLADVAVRRRLAAWLARGRGVARDLVLAGFLERGMPRRLAQRLPEPLRRVLFRSGKPLYGLRGGVLASWVLGAFLSLGAALPGIWERWSAGFTTDEVLAATAHVTVATRVAGLAATGFTPDGHRILTKSDDGHVRLWRVDAVPVPEVLPRGDTDTLSAVSLSPDGEWMATASRDGRIFVTRLDAPESLLRLIAPSPLTSIAYSPDGQRIAIGSARGIVWIMRPDGSQVDRAEFGDAVVSLRFNPDGQSLTVVTESGVLGYGVDSSRDPVLLRYITGTVAVAAISPDGEQVLVAFPDGSARVLRVGGSGPSVVLPRHRGRVLAADFSPDGRRVVTASADGTARVWHANGSGLPVVLEHGVPVRSARFSPDGQRVVTTDARARLRVWGRRPLWLNIASCTPSPERDELARRVADRLARAATGDTLRFAPVVFAPAAWDTLRLGTQPARGVIRFDPAEEGAGGRARRVAAEAESIDADSTIRWLTRGGPVPKSSLSIGLCDSYGSAPQTRRAPVRTGATGNASRPAPARADSIVAPADTLPVRLPTDAAPVVPRVSSEPAPSPTQAEIDEVTALRARNLLIPVEGVRAADLQNTFEEAREGGRVHDAIDIKAPRGTSVLAVTDGTILKLRQGARGGNSIYLLDADGRTLYYYAHLDRYAAGLKEGMRVRRGQVIGYVGDTGSASPGDYQLHFSIAVLSDRSRWWSGKNLNPYDIWRN